MPPLVRDLIQNIADIGRCRHEPPKFDQALVFLPVDIAGCIFATTLRNELAKQLAVVI